MSTVDILYAVMQDRLNETACRVCLRVGEGQMLTDSFVTCEGTLTMDSILAYVTRSQIIKDGCLPMVICNSCTENCLAAFTFMKTYELNIRALERYADYVSAYIDRNMHSVSEEFVITVLPNLTDYIGDVSINEYKIVKKETVANNDDTSVWDCTMCASSFDSKVLLKAHEQLHPPGTEHICRKCGNMYKHRTILNRHITEKHIIGAQKHLCVTCGKTYTSTIGLKEHQVLQHGINRTHHCANCEKIFENYEELEVHRIECEVEVPLTGVKEEIDVSVSCERGSDGGDPIVLKDKEKAMCHVCAKVFSRVDLASHVKSKHVSFRCSQCGKVFKVRSYYDAHIKKHFKSADDLKVHKCEYCDYKTNKKFLLTCHTRRRHTHVRPYVCEICGKGFYIRREVKLHMGVHTKEKPETCSVCNKSFGNKTSLVFHMRLHTGERPYKCNICDEGFLSSSRRGAHVRSKHQPRPQCHICAATFMDAQVLKKHIRNIHVKCGLKTQVSAGRKISTDVDIDGPPYE